MEPGGEPEGLKLGGSLGSQDMSGHQPMRMRETIIDLRKGGTLERKRKENAYVDRYLYFPFTNECHQKLIF